MIDIAIIGISCRFPDAINPYQYWQNLCNGKESISFFTNDDLSKQGIADDLLENNYYVKAKGALDNSEYFDPSCFKMNAYEGQAMDPQHRLFLECAHEVLYVTDYLYPRANHRIGIVGGASSISNYYQHVLADDTLTKKLDDFQIRMLTSHDFLTTYASYKLNLTGPSLMVQTACSTSLSAVAIACQQLILKQCELCLAGAVCVTLPLKAGYIYKPHGIMSPDGYCRPFSNKANGTVPGDGIGVVLLKRLDDALVDGDDIIAVIKGIGFNNDGASKMGFAAPSVDGQINAMQQAYQQAGIHPEQVSYLEAHGTGTLLGDPVEFMAMNEVFQSKQHCYLGAVKANIGHLDAAAGMAGLIKAALSLYYGNIPPLLHFNQVNEHIDLEHSAFMINTKLVSWPENRTPKFSAVSALGIGGTNLHIVLADSPLGNQSNPQKLQMNYPFKKQHLWLTKLVSNCKPKNSQTILSLNDQDVQSVVTQLWQHHLGYTTIASDALFYELGGDSITAIGIIDAINNYYKTDFKPHLMITCQTITALTNTIVQYKNHNQKQHTSQSAINFFPLVCLKKGTTEHAPLFLLHAIGGAVNYYQHLTKALPDKIPVYGLQSVLLETGETQELSIIEMAKHYLTLIKATQEKGPYYLAGHSFGGLLAYETAYQLQAIGDEIALLGMLDTPGFEQMPDPVTDTAEILITIANVLSPNSIRPSIDMTDLQALTEEAQLAFFLNTINHDDFRQVSVDKMQIFINVFKANALAMHNYQPKKFIPKNKILYIYAQNRDEVKVEQGWLDYIGAANIQLELAPGAHHTMMYPPHVHRIADIISQYLQIKK